MPRRSPSQPIDIDLPGSRGALAAPDGYSGLRHLAVIHVTGFAILAACIITMGPLEAWHALFIPGFFILTNLIEWALHRGPMHHRVAWFPLFEPHTLSHHRYFTHRNMPFCGTRDFYFMLFPIWFLPVAALGLLPIWYGLLAGFGITVANLFYVSAALYYLVYEWLHLAHHMAPDSFLGRRALFRALRRLHTVHHNPKHMMSGNFNVSFPLWDRILGTRIDVPGDPTT